ncbi:MAG: RNA methyltransferase [Nitriliruptoraceae bacterium]|nr:RNA methyltransferase [Nitriliruptoraceae bacterium]
MIRITDPQDERLADYAALTDAALRKRYEHQHGVLIAEGPNPVREVVASAYPLRSVLIAEERLSAMADVLAAIDAPVYVVDRDLLYEVVRFKLHQGVIACAGRLPPAEPSTVTAAAQRLAVLEGVGDHENLGTLFRSARALAIDAVVLGPGCADPLYRRSVRVSMGHVLHVAHTRVPDIVEVQRDLQADGITTLALTPAADATDLRDLELPAGARTAVLLGAEGPGLSDAALAAADHRVRIAMHAGVDSLNVAMAATVAFAHLAPR